MARRHRPQTSGYWPYPESWDTLQQELMGYNTGIRPLPWRVDRVFDTGTTEVATIIQDIVSLIGESWPSPPPVSEMASVAERANGDPLYGAIRAARRG